MCTARGVEGGRPVGVITLYLLNIQVLAVWERAVSLLSDHYAALGGAANAVRGRRPFINSDTRGYCAVAPPRTRFYEHSRLTINDNTTCI